MNDFEALIRRVPDDSFASPARSTVPLLDFWRAPRNRLAQLEENLHLAALVPATLSFEYPVSVFRGRGKPSYTDLMILSESTIIAVEAKFTEPRYQSVNKWLGTTPSENRRQVLQGWLDCISAVASRSLQIPDVASLPYQLIHRTASACSLVCRERVVVYQLFGSSDAAVYRRDLSAFSKMLTSQHIRFFLGSCLLTKSVRYAELEATWLRERHGLSDRVREAMLEEPLFTFATPSYTEVA